MGIHFSTLRVWYSWKIKLTDVKRGDGWILWGDKLRKVVCPIHHLPRDWVVHPKVAILDVLLSQFSCGGHLVSVRTFCPSLTFSFDEKAADWGPVPL